MSVNYLDKYVNVYLNSLNNTKFYGIVIIFSDLDYKLKKKLLFQLYFIKISSLWPFIQKNSKLYNDLPNCILPKNIKKYKWALYRYGLYYCFLNIYYKYFSNIFLLDLRDTFFQINPQKIKIKHAIYLCEDATYPFSIRDCKYNKKWLLPFFNISNKIFNKQPLNGGTIYGDSYMLLRFLRKYNKYLKKYCHITSDQGVINLIYYNNLCKNIKIIINNNGNGYIYNMGIELTSKNIFPNKSYYICNNVIHRIDKSIPYILHQYDRDISLKDFIFTKYLTNYDNK